MDDDVTEGPIFKDSNEHQLKIPQVEFMYKSPHFAKKQCSRIPETTVETAKQDIWPSASPICPAPSNHVNMLSTSTKENMRIVYNSPSETA